MRVCEAQNKVYTYETCSRDYGLHNTNIYHIYIYHIYQYK